MKKLACILAIIGSLAIVGVSGKTVEAASGCYIVEDRRTNPDHAYIFSCDGSGYVGTDIICGKSSAYTWSAGTTTKRTTHYKISGVPLSFSVYCPSTYPYLLDVLVYYWGS